MKLSYSTGKSINYWKPFQSKACLSVPRNPTTKIGDANAYSNTIHKSHKSENNSKKHQNPNNFYTVRTKKNIQWF